MARARKLNTWWSVTEWPSLSNSVLIGARAVAALSPKGAPFDLVFDGRVLHVSIAGVLQTGGPEDSRVYLSQTDFASWTGLQPSVMEIAVAGSPEEINGVISRLAALFPSAEIQPPRQTLAPQARVFHKTPPPLPPSVA